MCQAKLKGVSIGSTEIEFIPGEIKGGHYSADPRTAGLVLMYYTFNVYILIYIFTVENNFFFCMAFFINFISIIFFNLSSAKLYSPFRPFVPYTHYIIINTHNIICAVDF